MFFAQSNYEEDTEGEDKDSTDGGTNDCSSAAAHGVITVVTVVVVIVAVAGVCGESEAGVVAAETRVPVRIGE